MSEHVARRLLQLAKVHRESDHQLAIRTAARQTITLSGKVDRNSLGDLVFNAGKPRPSAFEPGRPLVNCVHVRRQISPGAGGSQTAAEAPAEIPGSGRV